MRDCLEVELVPDLAHCIETVARREYQDTTRRLMSADVVSDNLKERAEILRQFLQAADFRRLRAESEAYLQRGQSMRFLLHLEGGTVKYEMRTRVRPHKSDGP